MNRLLLRLVQVAILGVVLVDLAFWLHPPAGADLLVAAGRIPACSRLEAREAFRRAYGLRKAAGQLFDKTRVIESDGQFHLLQTPKGRFWLPKVNGAVIVSQLAEIASKYPGDSFPVRPGDTVIDCGANVGSFTRAALDGGAKMVVAVEPVPVNVECLRRNFAKEIAEARVVVYAKGVWEKEGLLPLFENAKSSTEDGFIIDRGEKPIQSLPVTTIDSLAAELKLDRIDFIKMDVEGAEQAALRGARRVLRDHHPRLEIEVNHLPSDPIQVPVLVGMAGRYRSRVLMCGFSLRRFRLEAESILFEPAE